MTAKAEELQIVMAMDIGLWQAWLAELPQTIGLSSSLLLSSLKMLKSKVGLRLGCRECVLF
jgi:hypothetical protein